MTVEATYKDEAIRYNEDANKWEWGGRSYTTLSGAKKAIDRRDTTVFTRTPCLVRRWGKWYGGEITSKADNGEYWVVVEKKSGQLEKRLEMAQEIYGDTPENRDIVEKSEELMKEADNLHREANELLAILTTAFFPAE